MFPLHSDMILATSLTISCGFIITRDDCMYQYKTASQQSHALVYYIKISAFSIFIRTLASYFRMVQWYN